MSYKSYCLALGVAGMSFAVLADNAFRLDDLVVTATATAQTADATLAPVTVITREAIVQSQARHISELLSQSPGVQVAASGGPGSPVGIYMRGTRTAQALVLVNGHRINSPGSGSAPLASLPLSQVERIEIVRGPRSSLYGADAVGGVINILTRQGQNSPALTVSLGAGTAPAGELGLDYNGLLEQGRFGLAARFYQTRGHDRTVNTSSTDGDRDGYGYAALSGYLRQNLTDDRVLNLQFTRTRSRSEYDNLALDDSKSPWPSAAVAFSGLTTVDGALSIPVNDLWQARWALGLSQDSREDRHTPYPGKVTSMRYSTRLVNEMAWGTQQLLTAGMDYTREQGKANPGYARQRRDNSAVFVENLSAFAASDLQLGWRYDHSSAYGPATTGQLAWGLALPWGQRLVLSYGTAFRAPTLLDLYDTIYGNPRLRPERAKNIELSLAGAWGAGGQWSVNLFQNDMNQLLAYDFAERTMKNIARARLRGVELALSKTLSRWELRGNLTVIDPRNRAGAYRGKVLYRRARTLFNLDIDRAVGWWTLGGSLRAQGPSWNDPANTEAVAGFAVLDLRAQRRISPRLQIQFKLVNLMDKQYTTTKGYIEEPRSGFIRLIWTPSA